MLWEYPFFIWHARIPQNFLIEARKSVLGLDLLNYFSEKGSFKYWILLDFLKRYLSNILLYYRICNLSHCKTFLRIGQEFRIFQTVSGTQCYVKPDTLWAQISCSQKNPKITDSFVHRLLLPNFSWAYFEGKLKLWKQRKVLSDSIIKSDKRVSN